MHIQLASEHPQPHISFSFCYSPGYVGLTNFLDKIFNNFLELFPMYILPLFGSLFFNIFKNFNILKDYQKHLSLNN